MTAETAVTIQNISTHLQRCGYRPPLLKRDFSYADQKVPLVGFSDQTYDARSACIAVIDAPENHTHSIEKYGDLGAPVLFNCCKNELYWWSITKEGSTLREKIEAKQVTGFFDKYKDKFSPQSIYRAKTIARLNPQKQLSFVDIGLMPLLEGKMGEQLSGLIERMLNALQKSLGNPNIEKTGKWLFRSAFWLLAAKVLKDKEVENFCKLNLEDPVSALQKVQRHYHSDRPFDTYSQRQLNALQETASILNDFGKLSCLTIESLAYVYENTQIDKNIRKALGIHATPSYLVDYIVWQMAGWFEKSHRKNAWFSNPVAVMHHF